MANFVSREPAYLLHSRHYSETSLLIDIFSLNYGSMRLVVKGALRPSNPFKGLLQPFQPLLLSWQGRSDLKTLTDIDSSSRLPVLRGDFLYSGLYLNELLSKLIQSCDPYPNLFLAYAEVMGNISARDSLEPALRAFEFSLLTELGAFPSFTKEAGTEKQIDYNTLYYWRHEKGFMKVDEHTMPSRMNGTASYSIGGRELIELSNADFSRKETLLAGKRLSRLMIDQLLGGRPLKSRELIAKTRELKKNGPTRK